MVIKEGTKYFTDQAGVNCLIEIIRDVTEVDPIPVNERLCNALMFISSGSYPLLLILEVINRNIESGEWKIVNKEEFDLIMKLL